MALAQRGDEDVVKAVVVVVAHGNAESEHGNRQPRFARDVGECAVAVVVVELQRGRAGVRVPGKIISVDQKDVGIAVVVVIDEGAARPHGFRQPLLSEGAVVVGEVDARLRGDVAEVNLLGVTRVANDKIINHRDTEAQRKLERKDLSFFSVSL